MADLRSQLLVLSRPLAVAPELQQKCFVHVCHLMSLFLVASDRRTEISLESRTQLNRATPEAQAVLNGEIRR